MFRIMEALDATLPYLVRYSYLGVYGLILVFSLPLPFSKTLVIGGGKRERKSTLASLSGRLFAHTSNDKGGCDA